MAEPRTVDLDTSTEDGQTSTTGPALQGEPILDTEPRGQAILRAGSISEEGREDLVAGSTSPVPTGSERIPARVVDPEPEQTASGPPTPDQDELRRLGHRLIARYLDMPEDVATEAIESFNPGTVQTAPFEAEVAKVSLRFARDRCYVAVGRVQRRAPGDFPLDVLVDLDAYDNDLKEAYQPGAQGPEEFIIGLTVSFCAEDRDVIQPLTVTDDRGISLTAVAFERIEHYLEDDLDD